MQNLRLTLLFSAHNSTILGDYYSCSPLLLEAYLLRASYKLWSWLVIEHATRFFVQLSQS